MFFETKCPKHEQILLREERIGYTDRSGYCQLCMKHYPLCNQILYMSICQKLHNHEGLHITKNGEEF